MTPRIQRILMLLLLCGCCSLWAILNGCALEDNTELEKSAVAAAERWLALVDAGEFESCWQMTSDIFKNAGDHAKWMRAMKTVRLPMGKTVSRQLKNARFKKSLPKAPSGRYVVVNFSTDFAKKKEVTETVASVLSSDGQWRVAGYHVQ